MRIRPVLVWLDCSCVWDACRGAVCCGALRSADGVLPLAEFGQTLVDRPVASGWRPRSPLRAGTNGFGRRGHRLATSYRCWTARRAALGPQFARGLQAQVSRLVQM